MKRTQKRKTWSHLFGSKHPSLACQSHQLLAAQNSALKWAWAPGPALTSPPPGSPLLLPSGPRRMVHSSMFPKASKRRRTSSSDCCLLSMPTKSFLSSGTKLGDAYPGQGPVGVGAGPGEQGWACPEEKGFRREGEARQKRGQGLRPGAGDR